MDYSIEIDEIMIYQFADEQIILHVIYAQPTICPRRASNTKPAPQSTPPLSSQTTSIDSLPSYANHASTAAPDDSAPGQAWDTPQPSQHSDMQHAAADIDFSLIWPDSENLFQSIMSTGTTDQWQMPLGTLPFPPVVQDVNTMNFGSPNSFDDRSSSIGTIPTGGSHQAVRDVTEMVTSSVGFLGRYSAGVNADTVIVFQCYS